MNPFEPHPRARSRWLWWLACAVLSQIAPQVSAAPAGTQAAVLYHNYCSVCHGDKGNGKSRASGALSTPPRDFTSEASRRELTRERLVLAITHGRPGTAMVGWKTQLSEADIGVLADHVLARFVRGDANASAAGPAASISGTQAHGGREADALGHQHALDFAQRGMRVRAELKRMGQYDQIKAVCRKRQCRVICDQCHLRVLVIRQRVAA